MEMWGRVRVVLLLVVLLWLGSGQEIISMYDTVRDQCINGEFNNETKLCECYPGWTGTNCTHCGGRLRLTDSNGVIADDTSGLNYTHNTFCMFYIEANNSVSSIHIKLRLFHLECQWDYLHVFDGDSIFSPKLAAYTGDFVEDTFLPAEINGTTGEEDNTTTTSPGNTTSLSPEHILSSSGPRMLLYFYTDAAASGPGFEISYWLDYECADECSGRGSCNESTGTCSCPLGWSGEACHTPSCPNNCSGHGACVSDICVCDGGFSGLDCSVEESMAHWSEVAYSSSLPPSTTLARASHSAVVWQDSIVVFGGYQFNIEEDEDSYSGSGNGVEPVATGDVLRHRIELQSWEVLNTSATAFIEVPEEGNETNATYLVPRLPAARYGHSAVLFNDSMYVFGGALLPSEELSNELWVLDLVSLQWTPLFDPPVNGTVSPDQLPVPVRGHTAHVIGSKMLIFFGLFPGVHAFLPYVQEYDLITGEWSLPLQYGFEVSGRMGHTSSYNRDEGLVYVYGGNIRGSTGGMILDELLTFDPACYVWSSLEASYSPRYLHSSVFLGPLFLSFGGCQGHSIGRDCFSNDLLVYNTLCDTWEQVDLPGLPANASRYGHTSVVSPLDDGSVLVFGGFVGTLREDMLQLVLGNCSQWLEEESCTNMSASLCAWRGGECLTVSAVGVKAQASFSCSVDGCRLQNTSASCSSNEGCHWSATSSMCFPDPRASCPSHPPLNRCSDLQSCQICLHHDCFWGRNSTHQFCYSSTDAMDPTFNLTEETTCSEDTSCSTHTTCESCTDFCLWCPSLSQCVSGSIYPIAFNFGQCLGWVGSRSTCDLRCEDRNNCSSCQELPQCGWCNDPSDTGLGVCLPGGFKGPRDDSVCLGTDFLGNQEEWQFYQCSACQCNGHSTCVNGSICEECANNTAGEHCESCSLGYFGDAQNGGSCAECNCNGYDFECNTLTGACRCQSLGVSGQNCTTCVGDYENGDADNFCYANLDVGFIYTFSTSTDNEVQGFYAVTPPRDDSLHFKFELSRNPNGQPVIIQLFLGRKTEGLWVLANITERLVISPRGSFERRFDDFSSSNNQSSPQIVSFAHPSIRNTSNFTELFDEAAPNDYTNHMWDRDVSLVLHIDNLTSPTTYRITVDQENYLFLLYFFVTFITCFSILLTVFLLVWYIKRKLAFRAYMRQQYIELQRRVARPFSRITLLMKNEPAPTLPTEQCPSYVAVETCHNDKAAVLSMLVRLPGDQKTGQPSHGRTGLCVGSTLVYVNTSKKPKQRKKQESQGEGQRTNSNNISNHSNPFVRHVGRRRNRTSDSEHLMADSVTV